MNNSEIKKNTKAAMKGKWGVAIGVLIVHSLLSSAISATAIGIVALPQIGRAHV